MLTATIENANTLNEFYNQIRSQQEDPKHHGPHYCAHHDMIQEQMKNCESYKELGLHQGASAAAALLSGAKEVHLVDHTLEKYNWQKHLFEKYCEENDVNLNVYECSSIDPKCAQPTDVLMIDSLHEWRWTIKELNLHAPITKKYIILHDTAIVNKRPSDIGPGMTMWCRTNPEWRIVKEVKVNVGAMLVERV
tara:strand:+ start:3138 stop:3716 length:579 start_codon:yes stop_codon:yes gene_type:complete